MEPLDLTLAPPRPPREKLLGLMFLPRTIDKLRAQQPGGNLGPFLNHDTGFSAYCIARVGLDMEALRTVVAGAPNEDAIIAWLRDRLDPARVEETNRKLETFTVSRMKPGDQVLVRERHPVMAVRPELDAILDIIEADDRAYALRT